MGIILNYKDCELGELKFENNYYIYNSSKFENEALNKYVGLISYDLQNSIDKKSEELFKIFKQEFLDNITIRKDLMDKVAKNAKNDYEILENFSKLNLDKSKYWLSNN